MHAGRNASSVAYHREQGWHHLKVRIVTTDRPRAPLDQPALRRYMTLL